MINDLLLIKTSTAVTSPQTQSPDRRKCNQINEAKSQSTDSDRARSPLLRHFCCEKREAQVSWVTDIIGMKVGRRSAETCTCRRGDEGLVEKLAWRGDFNEQNALRECRRRRPLSDFIAVESQPPKYVAQTLWTLKKPPEISHL